MAKRRKNDKPINEVLNQYLATSEKITKGVASVTIEHIFRSEMGPVVSNYTESIKLRGDTLFIQVKSAPLRSELLNARQHLMDNLNKRLGGNIIKKVVVR